MVLTTDIRGSDVGSLLIKYASKVCIKNDSIMIIIIKELPVVMTLRAVDIPTTCCNALIMIHTIIKTNIPEKRVYK